MLRLRSWWEILTPAQRERIISARIETMTGRPDPDSALLSRLADLLNEADLVRGQLLQMSSGVFIPELYEQPEPMEGR